MAAAETTDEILDQLMAALDHAWPHQAGLFLLNQEVRRSYRVRVSLSAGGICSCKPFSDQASWGLRLARIAGNLRAHTCSPAVFEYSLASIPID